MTWRRWLLLSLAVLFLYLLFWPVPVDPVAWEPPPPHLEEDYPSNNRLAATQRLEVPDGYGPEDVAVDQLGNIYGGLADGRIVRFRPGAGAPELFCNTGGRPLGLAFDHTGNLLVADGVKGLLSIDPQGAVTLLTNQLNGTPLGLVDDLDIAADGTIYFSDASWKFPLGDYQLDAIEHRPNGSLLSYTPSTGTTRLLLDSLYFANGVAVSPDQQFVLVNETWKYHIKRYWIAGPKSGTWDMFAERLPGFVDGVSSNGNDKFWVAIAAPPNPTVDLLAGQPFLRKVVARLPRFLWPAPSPFACVVALNAAGKVVDNLQEPSGQPYAFITSVEEVRGRLYFGSLEMAAIGWLPLAAERVNLHADGNYYCHSDRREESIRQGAPSVVPSRCASTEL